MTKRVREIRDLIIDEVSLVDKGANQHAAVTIAKSYDGEEEKGMEIFDEQGNPLDADALEDGAIVYGEDGQAYLYTAEADSDEDYEDEEEEVREPQLVGKAFRRPERVEKRASSAEVLREELSKALTDADRDAVIAKALGALDSYAEQANQAQEIAKAERDLRLDREYTEIAKSYNLPIRPDVLGPVMKRLAENMSDADCKVIAKAFEAAGEAIFEETGHRGGGDNADIFSQAEAVVDGLVSKSGISREQALASVFEENPDAYDEYLAGN
jgi:hypothetical protein